MMIDGWMDEQDENENEIENECECEEMETEHCELMLFFQ